LWSVLALLSLLYCCVGGLLAVAGFVYAIDNFKNFTGSTLDIVAISLLSIGGVLLLVGLVGFITSCCRSFAVSYSFSFILLFSILVQALAIILAIIFRPEVEKVISSALKQSISLYDEEETIYGRALDYLWNKTQEGLECCGIRTYRDWSSVPFGSRYGVPDACCTTITEGCGQNVNWDNPQNITKIGCFDKFGELAGDHLEIIIPVIIGVLVIQIFGVCFSCCLARSVQVEDCGEQVYWLEVLNKI